MGWLDRRRRLRDERNARREEAEKQAARPRIADAVRDLVPPAEKISIAVVGEAKLPPLSPFGSSMRIRDRLTALWHNFHARKVYIAMTDRHLIVCAQRSREQAGLTVPLAGIRETTCEHRESRAIGGMYGSTTVPEHHRIAIRSSDGMKLRLRIFPPWETEAGDLCQALHAWWVG